MKVLRRNLREGEMRLCAKCWEKVGLAQGGNLMDDYPAGKRKLADRGNADAALHLLRASKRLRNIFSVWEKET